MHKERLMFQAYHKEGPKMESTRAEVALRSREAREPT